MWSSVGRMDRGMECGAVLVGWREGWSVEQCW